MFIECFRHFVSTRSYISRLVMHAKRVRRKSKGMDVRTTKDQDQRKEPFGVVVALEENPNERDGYFAPDKHDLAAHT